MHEVKEYFQLNRTPISGRESRLFRIPWRSGDSVRSSGRTSNGIAFIEFFDRLTPRLALVTLLGPRNSLKM